MKETMSPSDYVQSAQQLMGMFPDGVPEEAVQDTVDAMSQEIEIDAGELWEVVNDLQKMETHIEARLKCEDWNFSALPLRAEIKQPQDSRFHEVEVKVFSDQDHSDEAQELASILCSAVELLAIVAELTDGVDRSYYSDLLKNDRFGMMPVLDRGFELVKELGSWGVSK